MDCKPTISGAICFRVKSSGQAAFAGWILPDRIRALLYIDALVVEDGESVFDVLPVASVERIMETVRTEGEGWKVPPVPASNYGFTGERLAWVDRRCCPQPLATMIQPISITGEARAVANKVYIYATGWGEMTSATASWARAEALGWRTHRWPCSHEVMIEKPGELAELIASL